MKYTTVKAEKSVVEKVSEYNRNVRDGKIQGEIIVVSRVCTSALGQALKKRGVMVWQRD